MNAAACVVWLGLVPLPRASDCPQCKPDDLCASHQESERKAIEEARGRIRSKDVAKRIAALRSIAELTKLHENAPARAAVETLAIGLKDDDFDVRALAAELIGDGQHPDASVKALADALDDVRTAFARLGRDRDRGAGGNEIGGKGARKYVEAVTAGLGRLPDDRSVDALADVLRQLGPDAPDALVVPVVHALVQLRSRAAVEAVIDRFVSAEGSRGQARAGGARGGGGSGGGGAGGGGAGGGGGGGGRPRRGDRDGDGFRDRGAGEEQKRALHDGLASLAREKGLDDAPAYEERVAQRWKDWFDRHAGSFPARLGRVGSIPVKPAEPAR
jgi:hypothetical protein